MSKKKSSDRYSPTSGLRDRRLPPEDPGAARVRFHRQGWDILVRCRQADRPYVRQVVDQLRTYHGLSIWYDEYSLGEIREARREIALARRAARFEVAYAGPTWDERPWRWLSPLRLRSKEEGEAWLVGQRPLPGSITVLLPGYQPSWRQQLFSRQPRPRFRSYGSVRFDAAAIVRVFRGFRILRTVLILLFAGLFFFGIAWALQRGLGVELPPQLQPSRVWGGSMLLAALLIPLLAWYLHLGWYIEAVRLFLQRARRQR
jgi:hypothetical protein